MAPVIPSTRRVYDEVLQAARDLAAPGEAPKPRAAAQGAPALPMKPGETKATPSGYESICIGTTTSARMERYLQLAARQNIQVCQPSNAAQYFHLLRRQALRRWRKPLVVFTPKSMLRNPAAASPIADFSRPRFQTVLPDGEVAGAQRVLLWRRADVATEPSLCRHRR